MKEQELKTEVARLTALLKEVYESCYHDGPCECSKDMCKLIEEGMYNQKAKGPNPAAQLMGALGGSATSKAKARSSAENGKLGGRPRKK